MWCAWIQQQAYCKLVNKKQRWVKIKMKTFASQTSSYGLVPGLPDFLKHIGSWFGVSTIDLESAGIPKLLCHFSLVIAPFFLPSSPFMLKYVVFLCITVDFCFWKPYMTTLGSSCGRMSWATSHCFLGDYRVLDALGFTCRTEIPERSLILLRNQYRPPALESQHPRLHIACHQSPVKAYQFPAASHILKHRC